MFATSAVSYALHYILQYPAPPTDTLLAVRTISQSTFAAEAGRVLYADGYDGNGLAASQTAWVYWGDFSAPAGTAATESAVDPRTTVYPNPADTHLTIVGAVGTLHAVRLLDATGRVVRQGTTSTLDVSTVAPGVYGLTIVTDAGSLTRRVVIGRD